ncbi:MAG TPA: twin-arginine translocation signal domain-containing protein [Actinomycetes bacterium]|nr:twin-arginine translocation signal domain-containing protein [Actinomycetes bacterium]
MDTDRRQFLRAVGVAGMGAAILVAVPIALVFNLFLDRFISGFTMGAVKG